jgi:hypothetical protein
MLNLTVDEGYAYDFLSIIDVKKTKKLCSVKLFNEYSKQIELQVGTDLHNQIINSKEYLKCVSVNEEIFNMVDLAKCDKVLASTVHKLNYDRYLYKLKLQKKWFPKSKITEKKN